MLATTSAPRFAALDPTRIPSLVVSSRLPVRGWIERRVVVLGLAAGLVATIFVLRQTTGEVSDPIALTYVIPISLVALELGLSAGLACAALALGLVGIWGLSAHADLDPTGVLSYGAAFLAVGGAAGHFSNRMRSVQRHHSQLLESGLALANLTRTEDLSETLARDARTLLGAPGARVELIDRAPFQSGVLEASAERFPIETRGIRYGTLAVGAPHAASREDRVKLGILTLQAAVAAENQRLLEDAQERAVLRTELHDARSHLEERGDQLRELIARQEAERHHVADELHEQAAQTLAGVLLGLRALERELESDLAGPRLGTLRSNVDGTLQMLRALAVSLQPPVLQLGLETALEALADDTRDRSGTEMTVALEGVGELSAEAEVIVYRVVEEALDALGGARSVVVRAEPAERRLVIMLEGAADAIPRERLAVLRARLELVHGTLLATTSELRAVICCDAATCFQEPATGRPREHAI
jgi:signal transduction histidine kinase